MDIDALCWPISRLGEGMEELVRRAGLRPVSTDPLLVPEAAVHGAADELERWIEWAGTRLGIEAEAVQASVPEFERLLRHAGPALLLLRNLQGLQFLLLSGVGASGRLRLIGPDLRLRLCPAELVRAAMCASHEAPLTAEIERLLAVAEVPLRRRRGVRAVMLGERLATQRVEGCWILRQPATTGFWRQLVQARLPRRVAFMLALFGVVYGLEIQGWRLIGEAALNGRLDLGWLTAWVLLVASMVPLQLLSGWLDASFALDAGRILKQRLLAGALRMDLDAVRRLGVGQLLGRVMESQALESLALNGGLTVLVALVELVFAVWILNLGTGGRLHLILLLGWLVLICALAWNYYKRLRGWTVMRLGMTHDLVERMVGHRTRLAQDRASRRDAEEDRVTQGYLYASKAMDQAVTPVVAAAPGGWILIGLIGLAPGFVSGTATSAGLAIGLGGVLFAHRAFTGIADGLTSLSRAIIAWRQVATMFDAGAKDDATEPFVTLAQSGAGADGVRTKLVDASQLVFRYTPDGEAVLRGVDLTIHHGERILLEGASGGGKSTLAALLVGLRRPNSGLLLLNGLDRHTLGESWHRLATEAPQFHENHILTGTLGFNLLMGRNWPASDDELQEAKDLCVELGLGELLERMPSAMKQMVGETGWQLSHGERSRIFLARALLQRAQLTVLDESFAALDPETLHKCLACALRRAQTLLVIAHP